MSNSSFPRPINPGGQSKIAPTDISQFIRLEQCERYLRLRLHVSAFGSGFMREHDVAAQRITPLLSRSGAQFESAVEGLVRLNHRAHTFVSEGRGLQGQPPDNDEVVRFASELQPGETLVLFQPRIEADVDGWRMRGDVDLLRLERDSEGRLHVLIADMKSSTSAKVEHRLQVAFYHEMLDRLLRLHNVACASIRMAILYRGPVDDGAGIDDAERDRRERERFDAQAFFGVDGAMLEIVKHPESYIGAVADLVTSEASTARRVADASFDDIPFHLTYKCDGCIYNEFCMKSSATNDDLSLIPHLTAQDKRGLAQAGVTRTAQLAALMQPSGAGYGDLTPAPGRAADVERLSATWPVGPRLEELVHRARNYRRSLGEQLETVRNIPSKGYSSLPHSSPDNNPNLIRVFIDAQHDYLTDRIYMLGALVVANRAGDDEENGRRSIVQITSGPPTDALEQELFEGWVNETLEAVVELAARADGQPEDEATSAPIHLIFFNSFEQRLLLDGLARHFTSIMSATPLYDLVTQIAAFDSSIVSHLDQEIREHKNYPLVCQSLQALAMLLKFDWAPFHEQFRERLFDSRGTLDIDDATRWYTRRARFNSQIPLEFAYAAWGQLPEPPEGKADDYASFRDATIGAVTSFHARRLEAIDWIARDLRGNPYTTKTPFHLPDLASFTSKAETLAQALDEFLIVERHTELAAWTTMRLTPPERRVLSGDTLLVRYVEEDNGADIVERNRENQRRKPLNDRYRTEYREQHPDAKSVRLPKEQRDESGWTQEDMTFRFRIVTDGVGCPLNDVLALTNLRDDAWLVVCPRLKLDETAEGDEPVYRQVTPKQMLGGIRAGLTRLEVERDAAGRATRAWAHVTIKGSRGGGQRHGFVFGTYPFMNLPFTDGELYTLDPDPNAPFSGSCAELTGALAADPEGTRNTLYERIADPESWQASWPAEAAEGQRRFLAGIDALSRRESGLDFEPSKREYISEHGDTPVLLVQGPPGTGKTYSTSFALFARLQGALAAGMPWRAFVSCRTHAATDVLLNKIADVQAQLARWRAEYPDDFAAWFDARLLDVELFRMRSNGSNPESVRKLYANYNKPKSGQAAAAQLRATDWCVVGSTPAGIRQIVRSDAAGMPPLADCLVLDEASQMNLPEAVMAAMPLKEDGQLLVVGDHRQMPPIVKHDWANEPRRSFKEFRSYESLFLTLRELNPPMIKFAESFRLHAAMAEFLRREVYVNDDIDFFSRRTDILQTGEYSDEFVAAVLDANHPLIVVVHDEQRSQLANPFERDLLLPVLEALTATPHHLSARRGLGVVVPHRAQRAALQTAAPFLAERDETTGDIVRWAVDTVERYQGDERNAIIVSATESDPQYLQISSGFLLDPRRLTVALSRAEEKIILVASRSVFNVFSADEETFANAQLWKNLLRFTCTVPLWCGVRDAGGHSVGVEVWGNQPARPIDDAPTTPAVEHALIADD